MVENGNGLNPERYRGLRPLSDTQEPSERTYSKHQTSTVKEIAGKLYGGESTLEEQAALLSPRKMWSKKAAVGAIAFASLCSAAACCTTYFITTPFGRKVLDRIQSGQPLLPW